ncbi:hypothetical protein LZ31DRAFT_556506 [Colletotrichum somersetense]|nr:hypothetical protein LZ31DRAFT_556506 [Colletotrichum somersetense]
MDPVFFFRLFAAVGFIVIIVILICLKACLYCINVSVRHTVRYRFFLIFQDRQQRYVLSGDA